MEDADVDVAVAAVKPSYCSVRGSVQEKLGIFAFLGDAEGVRRALEDGMFCDNFNVDAACYDKNGRTPGLNPALLLACMKSGEEYTKVVKLLLSNCANPDVGRHDCTPLLAACKLGNVEVVFCLLRSRADPNKADAKGRTPVLECLLRKDLRCLSALQCGPAKLDVNAPLQNGKTPLQFVLELGWLEGAATLQVMGAYRAPRDGMITISATVPPSPAALSPMSAPSLS